MIKVILELYLVIGFIVALRVWRRALRNFDEMFKELTDYEKEEGHTILTFDNVKDGVEVFMRLMLTWPKQVYNYARGYLAGVKLQWNKKWMETKIRINEKLNKQN